MKNLLVYAFLMGLILMTACKKEEAVKPEPKVEFSYIGENALGIIGGYTVRAVYLDYNSYYWIKFSVKGYKNALDPELVYENSYSDTIRTEYSSHWEKNFQCGNRIEHLVLEGSAVKLETAW